MRFTYNNYGQLTNDQQSHSGAVTGSTPQVQYAYASGSANTIRPTSLTYPNGRVLNMNYAAAQSMSDALSRVAALVDNNGVTQLAAYSYLGAGTFVNTDLTQPSLRQTYIDLNGNNDPDTGDIYSGFDRFGRVKDHRWWNYGTSTDAARLQHGYDRASNRLWRLDTVAAANSAKFDELYTYDGAYRLSNMQRGTLNAQRTAISSGTATFGQCFTLDATGNWGAFRQDNNGDGTWDLVQSRSSNTVNEITGVTNSTGSAWSVPAYNAVGNMTTLPQPADPTKSYTATYDAWNRLVKLVDGANTVADYAYDGRKYRVVSRTYTAGVLTETRHHYYTAGWQCIEERLGTTPDSANPNRQFVWGLRYIDDLVERDRDTGGGTLSERLYGLQDANWNMVALSNTTGTIQERYAYSPYGVPVFLTATFGSRTSSIFAWERLFTGQTYDTSTGLHYFRNRMLHSQVGTFLTRDPIGYVDGLSLYRAWFAPQTRDPHGMFLDDDALVRAVLGQPIGANPGLVNALNPAEQPPRTPQTPDRVSNTSGFPTPPPFLPIAGDLSNLHQQEDAGYLFFLEMIPDGQWHFSANKYIYTTFKYKDCKKLEQDIYASMTTFKLFNNPANTIARAKFIPGVNMVAFTPHSYRYYLNLLNPWNTESNYVYLIYKPGDKMIAATTGPARTLGGFGKLG